MISDDVQPEGGSEDQPLASTEVNGEAPVEGSDSGQAQAATDEAAPAAEAVAAGAAATGAGRQSAPRGGRASRARRSSTAVAEPESGVALEAAPPPRLLEMYRNEIVPAIMREFGFTNPMRVPHIQKIVLNIGLGEALTNNRAMDGATGDLTSITGQKPVITRARKSIAGFKVREGNPIGTSVTLRGSRMYHFLDRFINTALPRIRDFRGIQRTGFDGRGNFSIGIREQIIFPEIDYNSIDRIRGLQVTIATSARDDAEAIRLLELYGMPFVRQA